MAPHCRAGAHRADRPIVAGLGPARTRSQHRHRRVVGMDHTADHDMLGDQLTQRAQPARRGGPATGELASVDVKAAAGVDLGLPV